MAENSPRQRRAAVRLLFPLVLLMAGVQTASAQDAGLETDPNGKTDANNIVVLTSVPRTIDPNESISPEAIELSPSERTVLGATRDRNSNLWHNAMYVLLGKARSLAPLSSAELAALERPSYAKMMRHPELYRGQPIQLDVYVMTVKRLEAGKGLPIKPGIKPGDAIWELGCHIYHDDMNVSRAMPFFVYSLMDPNEALGTPIESDTGETSGYYRRARIACLFYKLLKTEGRDGKERIYPTTVAWQFVDKGTVDPGWSPYQVFGLTAVILLGLGLLYRTMRRYRNYARQSAQTRGKYVPLRDEEDPEDNEQIEQEADQVVDGPVDPELASAAEEHIRDLRSEENDDTDDSR